MTDQPNTLTPDQVNAIVRDMDDPRYPSQITVFCDHCGTEFTGEFMVSEEMTSTERLAVARRHLVQNEGWEHTDDGDDFCPEHAGTNAKQQLSTACAKCQQPFDPADMRFNGAARWCDSPFCRSCVDRCHESTDFAHECAICR